MPHVTIEHSANLADAVDVDALVTAVHEAVLATGIAPLDALRTRAAARSHYAIADRDPSNTFVAVTARLGPGRSDADLQRLLAVLLDTVERQLGDTVHTAMLSAEIQEIDPMRRVNRNHLRAALAARRPEE